MIRRQDLDTLPERELLGLRFKDFSLDLRGSWLEDLIRQVLGELRRKGLLIRPHFWLSTEWFVADGGTGVAVPFYLLHPRLTELERRQVGFAEGEGGEALRLLRHELGHVVDHAYRLQEAAGREEIFGSSARPYRATYEPRRYSKSFVHHLPGYYAQSHPDEDFAETFAVWLTPGANWRQEYQNWPALKKLKYMDRLMKSVAGGRPPVKNPTELESIVGSAMTLGQHYQKRRRRYRSGYTRRMDRSLLRNFSVAGGSRQAHRYLRENRRELVREVAQRAGLYQYKVNRVVQEMINRSQQLNLHMSVSERILSSRLKKVLVSESRHFEENGLYREIR